MEDILETLGSAIAQFTVIDAIDIVLVSLVIYWLLKVTSKTRAVQVMRGVVIVLALYAICSLLNIEAMKWLLNYIISAGVIAIVVLFQPELRAALERLGRGRIFSGDELVEDVQKSVDNLHRALLTLSKSRTGALVVIEQSTGLNDVIESGTPLSALITQPLLENIFFPNTPLHDGAVIIRGLRIAAAGCFLPLSANAGLDRELGTRHRAALGVSEVSDCVVLVVSEETGVISCARNGELTRYINSKQLSDLLYEIFTDKSVVKKLRVRRNREEKE